MVVLVGGGIGVTPWASVLSDLVNRIEATRCVNCNYVRSASLRLLSAPCAL